MAVNPNINTTASQSQKDAQSAQNFREISQRLDTNVIKDKDGNRRVIVGQLPDGDYGIEVSQADVDVLDATDDQLVMSSAFNMFKIVDSGTATVTLANPVTHFSDNTTSYTHNLGYVPGAVVFVTVDSGLGGELIGVPTTRFDALGNFGFTAHFDVTSTAITFHIQPGAASAYDGTEWNFKFYLIRETASV